MMQMQSPAGGGYNDLGAMLQQLFEKMAREEPDAFARMAAARRREKQESFARGDTGGMYDTQLAGVNAGQTKFDRLKTLEGAAAANRTRAQRDAAAERGKINNVAAANARKAELAKQGKVGTGYAVTGGDGSPYQATAMAGKMKTDAGTFESADAAGSAARKKIEELLRSNAAAGIAARLGLIV